MKIDLFRRYLMSISLIYYPAIFSLIIFFSSAAMSEDNTTRSLASRNSLDHQGDNLLHVALSLLVVVVLIFLIAWFAKRLASLNGINSGVMSVKASLQLSPKEKLMVVQIGDEQVVIGVASGFVGHIKTLDKPLDKLLVREDTTFFSTLSNESFSNTLQTLLNRQQKKTETDVEKNG